MRRSKVKPRASAHPHRRKRINHLDSVHAEAEGFGEETPVHERTHRCSFHRDALNIQVGPFGVIRTTTTQKQLLLLDDEADALIGGLLLQAREAGRIDIAEGLEERRALV